EVLLLATVPFDVDLAAVHVNMNPLVVGIGNAARNARRQSLGNRAALIQGQLNRAWGKHGCNAGVVPELDAAGRSKLKGRISCVAGRDVVPAKKGDAGGNGVAVDRHAPADIAPSRGGLWGEALWGKGVFPDVRSRGERSKREDRHNRQRQGDADV